MTFKRLINGFRDFQNEYFKSDSDLFEKLVNDGQSPEALVIACSDSRIDPAILTRSEPGDIFSVRNVAAMVPPYTADTRYHGTSSAIEYAVKALKVKYIIVMGHQHCGGIRALAQSPDTEEDEDSFIQQWISIGRRARKAVHSILEDSSEDEQLRALEQSSILVSLNNLLSFPWVREAVEAGHLHLHGWYFDMTHGKLLGYNPETMHFEDILKSQNLPAISTSHAYGYGCESVTLALPRFLNQLRDTPLPEATLEKKSQRNRLPLKDRLKQFACTCAASSTMGLEEIAPLIAGLV